MSRRRLCGHLLLLFALVFPPALLHAQEGPSEELLRATVLDVTASPDQAGSQAVQIRILTGTDAGKELTIEQDRQEQWRIKEGDAVVVRKLMKTDATVDYALAEAYRLPALIWIGLLFAGLAVLLGGRKGIGSITGLLLSIGILVFFVVPKIAEGYDPVLISLTGALAITCTSLYLAHGFTKRTSVALLSTLVTLAIASGLASLFVHAAALFGTGSEEAMFLQYGALGDVNLRGLLLGGIIIGCLGVLDDVTVAQTAVVDELIKANPSLDARSLIRSSLSVGKEHIASMVNTLALAYAGASMPLLLLFTVPNDYPLWFTLNGELLAEEIIRTLVGSTSLLFAVPIATVFATFLLRRRLVAVSPASLPPHGHHARNA